MYAGLVEVLTDHVRPDPISKDRDHVTGDTCENRAARWCGDWLELMRTREKLYFSCVT